MEHYGGPERGGVPVVLLLLPFTPLSVVPLLGQWGQGEGEGTPAAYFAGENLGPGS